MLGPGNWLLRRSRIKSAAVIAICGLVLVALVASVTEPDRPPQRPPPVGDVVKTFFGFGFAVLAPIACWHRRRIRWAQRAAMALLFVACVAIAIDVARPDEVLPTNAIHLGAAASVLLFGAPCLLYAFLGRFRLTPHPIRIPPPMLEAVARRAQDDIARLRFAVAKGHRTHVAFALHDVEAQLVSILWGRVCSIEGGTVLVEPLAPAPRVDGARLELRLADVVDWEVEVDGERQGRHLLAALTDAADRAGYDLPAALRRGRARVAGTFATGSAFARARRRVAAAFRAPTTT